MRDAHELSATARSNRHAHWLALALTLAGLAVSLAMGLASDGLYQDDDACHFLFARDGWGRLDLLLNWWARPGYNLLTSPVARFLGMPGCRVLSTLMTAAIALLAYGIARRIGVPPMWAALAPALVWMQPVTLTLSMTTLTETPAALYLTLGVYLYLRGHRVWACAVVSLAFVTRLETPALAPLFVLAVALDAWRLAGRNVVKALRTGWACAAAAALLWAPAAWILVAYVADLPPACSPLHAIFMEHTAQYGRGPWHHYLTAWAGAFSLGVVALAVGGAIAVGRKGWLVWANAFGLVALHAMLFSLGLFASGGYPRFLVPGAGLTAALAAGGLAALWRARPAAAVAALTAPALFALAVWTNPAGVIESFRHAHPRAFWAMVLGVGVLVPLALAAACWPGTRRRMISRVLAAVLVACAAFQTAYQVKILRFGQDVYGLDYALREALEALDGSPYADRPALTQHVVLAMKRPRTRHIGGDELALEAWDRARPGTLFLWDSKYCWKIGPDGPVRSSARLLASLRRRGRLIANTHAKITGEVRVFERLPD